VSSEAQKRRGLFENKGRFVYLVSPQKVKRANCNDLLNHYKYGWYGVYQQSRYVALFTTDISLSIEQVIEFYGVGWKIETGFKEIKQEINSTRSQTHNVDAVNNHLNFCMKALY
jgi:transposase